MTVKEINGARAFGVQDGHVLHLVTVTPHGPAYVSCTCDALCCGHIDRVRDLLAREDQDRIERERAMNIRVLPDEPETLEQIVWRAA